MSRIGIIGGGLAGLTVAYRRLLAGDRVVLFEAAPRLGGQLWTELAAGFVIEHGAEGFVARSQAIPELARDLGIGDALIGQSTFKSYGWNGSILAELAPGQAGAFLGFQVAKDELGQGIKTFRSGMGMLTDALREATASGLSLHVATAVAEMTQHRSVVRIVPRKGAPAEVDLAVIALPAREAAALLEPLAGEPARALASAPTLSSVTVSLAYDRADIDHPLEGTGFVVAPPYQHHGFRACTFTSAKFEARAPQGFASLRIFFRPSADDLGRLDDADWTGRAHEALRSVLPVRTGPRRAWVSRWPDALPVFDAEHARKIGELEGALSGRSILLTGSAFHGSGLDAAVCSAEACAAACG